jgi:hypothetical protein
VREVTTWYYEGRRKAVVLVLDTFPERKEVLLLDLNTGFYFSVTCKSDEVLAEVRNGALLEVEIDQYYSFDTPEAREFRKMSGGLLDREYRLELVSAKPLEEEE